MKAGGQKPKGAAGSIVRKLLFWEFPRGSWQYDLVVAVILIFIFAFPRDWFSDQPRATNVVLISNDRGSLQLFIEAALLNGIPEAQRNERAGEIIRQRTGKRLTVLRVEPIRDEAEQEVKGFIAYTSAQH